MDYIHQAQLKQLEGLVQPGKVVVIYGPRRVGKTTLINHYAESSKEDYLLVTGEDVAVQDFLQSQSIEKLRSFVGHKKLLIIDEAQAVKNIGINLKLMVDHIPELKIIATGSSSFDLANETGEPLTGRKFTLKLLPLAQLELKSVEDAHVTAARLESRLIFGSYPEVALGDSDEMRVRYLKELVSSYLFKDLLQYEDLRNPDRLTRLLQLLAFQIGRDVSAAELGTQLSLNQRTVTRYLDLLEKVFVIYHRSGFSRNLRKEITKSRRYYFVDLGIRNTLINNFNPLTLRDDTGALWENYILTERMKHHLYGGREVPSWFWRTYDQQEIDLVEEQGGMLMGFEIKWSASAKQQPPGAWKANYPESKFEVITPQNYLPFIGA